MLETQHASKMKLQARWSWPIPGVVVSVWVFRCLLLLDFCCFRLLCGGVNDWIYGVENQGGGGGNWNFGAFGTILLHL